MLEVKTHVAVYIIIALVLWGNHVWKKQKFHIDIEQWLIVTSGLFLFGECLAWVFYLGIVI